MAKYLLKDNHHFETVISQRTVMANTPYLVPILDRLSPDFVFLDVGCGPGGITCDLARRYPRATILGIDCSTHAIETAQTSAKSAGLTNVRFAVGDALNLTAIAASQTGFELVVGGCDVAHTHQIFMHVQDARLLSRQLHKAVKPHGGLVCSREADPLAVHLHPLAPGIIEVVAAAAAMMQTRGQNPRASCELLTYALAAGFRREDISIEMDIWPVTTPAERQEVIDTIVVSLKDIFLRNETAAAMLSTSIYQVLDEAQTWVHTDGAYMHIPCARMVCRRRD